MDQWGSKEPDKHRKLDLAILAGNKKEYNLYISTAVILFFPGLCHSAVLCMLYDNMEGMKFQALREKQEEKDIQQPRHIPIYVLFLLTSIT